MSYLDKIRACNRHEPRGFVPFHVAGQRVGWLLPDFAAALADWPWVFAASRRGVAIRDELSGFAQRTAALDGVVSGLVDAGVISHLHGERYAVTMTTPDAALLTIDRTAAGYFGVRAFGQHLNGYVRRPDGLWMWLARRARDRIHAPGKLDQMVAGGLPYGVGLDENLAKECLEEATLPAVLAHQAVATGHVSYCRQTSAGLKPDLIYCYDLELDEAFTPCANDGEVEGFELWPIEAVATAVRETDAFKLNCNLVVIDFLLRHGVLTAEMPDHAAIVSGLRSPADLVGAP